MTAVIINFPHRPTAKTDDRFGECPQCGGFDAYLNIGPCHFFFCEAHRFAWLGGVGIFRTWREEDENLWWENIRLISTYELVERSDLDPGEAAA